MTRGKGSARGIARERKVRDYLLERDYFVCRAAGSIGDADLVALKAGHRPMLIEVKSTAQGPYEKFGPKDRADLSFAAQIAGADAYLYWWPPRGVLHIIAESEWPSPLKLVGDGANG